MENRANKLKFNDEIKRLFIKSGFKPSERVSNSPQSSHLLVKGHIGEMEALFKSYGNSIAIKSANILREGQASQFLKKTNQSQGNNIPIFEVIDYGKSKNFSWLIRKYYQGETLGINSNQCSDFLYIDRFTHLNEKIISKYKTVVDQINKKIRILTTLDANDNELAQFNAKRFIDKPSPDLFLKMSHCLDLNLDRQEKLFNQNLKSFFSKNNLRATVSDLAPTNVFIKNGGDILFYDLEWFCLDNYMIDITFFWLLLWRYHNFQNEIIKIAVKSDQDKQYFRINLIRIVITLFDLIFNDGEKETKHYQKTKLICQDHIWSKYLQSAGNSYEDILSVN